MAAKPKRRKSEDDAPAEEASSRSGGVNIDGDATVGRDVVGRDKTIRAGGHIVHAEPGATVIIGERPAPEPEDLSPAPGEPPFKGLQYFDEADADLFFGRELLTAKLVARLSPSPDSAGEGWGGGRFLAVVGASGSGKSSVVRAGLVPALKRGEPLVDGTLPPDGSARWPVHVITPTAHPLKELAASLTGDAESVTATATLMDDLARDPRSLDLAVSRVLKQGAGGNRLLLVVDQFEELFTACKDDAERKAFVDNLLTAVETDGPTIVVITLRADFYAHCAQFDNLREALARRQEYIGPMSAGELRRAIEEPAKRGDWEFESGLVDLLLRDVGDEPGALPLLSHALLETWKRRRGRTLTLAGYHESGGVHGAIAKTAETVFNQRLTPEQQPIARNIFLRLTELGEGTQDTRRRASFNELVPNPQLQPSVESVLKILADARLVTTAEGTAEVAHEALIREWPTLREWLDEDREGLRIHRQLSEDAQDWVALNRDEGALYRGARLAAASEWSKDHADEMNPLEREFLDASHALQVSELEAAKRRAEEQARIAAQLRQQARFLIAALIVAGVLAMAAVAFSQQSNRNAAEANSLALAGSAKLALTNNNTDLAVALALEANRIVRPPVQAQLVLAEAAYAPGTRRRFVGYDAGVLSVTLSPDGRAALSGSADNSLILWDVESGAELHRFLGHTGWVYGVAFSPDGRTALSGSADGSLILWDIETGAKIRVFVGHSDVVTSVALGPDGHIAVSGSKDQSLIVWNVEDGTQIRRLLGHTDGVTSVSISPDGRTALSGSRDASVRLWDMESGAEIRRFTGHTAAVSSVAFSPDGRTALSGSADTNLILWNVENGTEIRRFVGHEAEVLSVAFSPDTRMAVSGSADNSLILWDVESGVQLYHFVGHTDPVMSVAFGPEGHTILSGSWDASVRLWALDNGALLDRLLGHNAPVLSVALSPDGRTALSGAADNSLILWDLRTATEMRRFVGHTSWVYGVVFSSDGRTALSASADGNLILWDIETGAVIRRFRGHGDEVTSVALSPDGRTALSGSRDNSLILWDVESGEEIRRFVGHTDWVWSVSFSSDGRMALSGSSDRTLRLWDIETGAEIRRFSNHPRGVLSVAASPNGQTLLTGSADGILRLWNIESETEVRRFVGHTNWVTGVAFSRDGRVAVSASRDNTLRLWDIESGAEIRRFVGHTNWVTSVAFDPQAHTAISGSWDNSLRVWWMSFSLDELIEWTHANRYLYELSCIERELYRVEPLCDSTGASLTQAEAK